MTDPIADLLVRIKNAYLAQKKEASIPFSKMKKGIVSILEQREFIEKYSVEGKIPRKKIKIALKYKDNQPTVFDFKMISKPGRRIYKGYSDLNLVRNGYGISILSTSQGIITNYEAKKKKIGGEVICEIYE